MIRHDEAPIRIRIDNVATGGAGVGRAADGRVVFVPGALPGELVDAVIERRHRRHADARLLDVVEAVAGRVAEPCAHRLEGCGGCDLLHAGAELARDLRRRIVADALARIGGLGDVEVLDGGGVSPTGYRTTVRAAVIDGRAGFRRRNGHEVVAAPNCGVAHPLVREVLAQGTFPGASEVVVRAGTADDEVVALVEPSADGAVAGGARIVGADSPEASAVVVHEEVLGRRLRVSMGSFFQSGPQAAALLVATVQGLLEGVRPAVVADLYAGIGLFAGAVEADRVVAVESNPWAVADAEVNLAAIDARVVRSRVERWRPEPVDVVIADPARRGLAADGVAVVATTGAPVVVLVSCDPGSLGRDAKLLVGAGFTLDRAVALDLFPGTSHVETVARFRR